jgi:putative component of toxin-antitoxin plasmid stabilization module
VRQRSADDAVEQSCADLAAVNYKLQWSCDTTGEVVVLLLCGGDKGSQDDDIEQAKKYFEDFKKRSPRKQGGR